MTSACSSEEVNTTVGNRRVRSSALTRLRTSSPSTLGRCRSSRMRCGMTLGSRPSWRPVANRYSRASAPSRATTTSLRMLCFLRVLRVISSSSALSSTSKIVSSLTIGLTTFRRTLGADATPGKTQDTTRYGPPTSRLTRTRTTDATTSGALRPPEGLRWPGGAPPSGVLSDRLRGFLRLCAWARQQLGDALQGSGQQVVTPTNLLLSGVELAFEGLDARPQLGDGLVLRVDQRRRGG